MIFLQIGGCEAVNYQESCTSTFRVCSASCSCHKLHTIKSDQKYKSNTCSTYWQKAYKFIGDNHNYTPFNRVNETKILPPLMSSEA